jgi:IS5 family transposase
LTCFDWNWSTSSTTVTLLVQLAKRIDWQACEAKFGGLYASGVGRPGHPIRLMVGLQLLKQICNVSDEELVSVWIENPYWQHLCGEQYFRHDSPIDPSLMTMFRKRIGTVGCEFILGLTVKVGLVAYMDRGYKGHGLTDLKVWIAGAKRGVTARIKSKLKRRNAIEPVIGHMKADGRLGRNFLKGQIGDEMNAILCAAGHNLRKTLNKLRLFCAQQIWLLVRLFELLILDSIPTQCQFTVWAGK